MYDITAGAGKSLPELRDALFGPSKSAKAFRAVMKDPPGPWKKDVDTTPLLPLAAVAIRDLAGSQVFKAEVDIPGWTWKDVQDPALFALHNGYRLKDLKQWLDTATGTLPTRLSKWTGEFLKKWVNTNGYSMPTPNKDVVRELLPFRPEVTRVYYRGIRFRDIGEMVKFHQHFAAGKMFPFESSGYSSWTTSKATAEKFGRISPASSQHDAMMGWLSSFKEGKDYAGNGGYVVGARVAPEQCLVDLTHHDIPFRGGQHGNEGEVIVLPDTRLTCKVYTVFGDPEADVERFLHSKYDRKSPRDPYFFQYPLGQGHVVSIQGDDEEGDVVFDLDKLKATFNDEYLSRYDGNYQDRIPETFHRYLYEAEWVAPDRVHYQRMSLPKRVASLWLRQSA